MVIIKFAILTFPFPSFLCLTCWPVRSTLVRQNYGQKRSGVTPRDAETVDRC